MNWSLQQEEWWKKYIKKTKIRWWIIFARYFGLQHKPSTGAIYKAAQLRFVVAASQLTLSFALPSPTLLQKAVVLSFFVFLSEPLKIASERSKLLLAYSRRSDRGEHAVRHYPKAGNRLNCCRRVIKKKTEAPFSLLIRDGGSGGGGREIECPILFSAPTHPLHFLISLRRCWVGWIAFPFLFLLNSDQAIQ